MYTNQRSVIEHHLDTALLYFEAKRENQANQQMITKIESTRVTRTFVPVVVISMDGYPQYTPPKNKTKNNTNKTKQNKINKNK